MHRSGTSCLTGITQRFGVELGDVFTENPFNKKGNRENARIMSLNNDVLATNGGSWDMPVLATSWTKEQCIERDEIIDNLTSTNSSHWGFKDPRTLLTLPFWSESIKPQFIGTVRHPAMVAHSLNKRDPNNISIEKGLSLWLYYNQQLLDLAKKHCFPIVNFDLPPKDYLTDTTSKLTILGLDTEMSHSASEFFDQSLRNNLIDSHHTYTLPNKISDLYAKIINLT